MKHHHNLRINIKFSRQRDCYNYLRTIIKVEVKSPLVSRETTKNRCLPFYWDLSLLRLIIPNYSWINLVSIRMKRVPKGMWRDSSQEIRQKESESKNFDQRHFNYYKIRRGIVIKKYKINKRRWREDSVFLLFNNTVEDKTIITWRCWIMYRLHTNLNIYKTYTEEERSEIFIHIKRSN